MLGSSFPNEAASAYKRLVKLLARHGVSWNDLPEILTAVIPPGPSSTASSSTASSASRAASTPEVNVFDLVSQLIEDHVVVTADERAAIVLWVLHTHVFDRFAVTPRLALLSPVRGCGKTTLLILIEQLASNAMRSDNVTAAAVYYHLDRRPRTTLLIDEGDNLGLLNNAVLRAVFNSGHRRGGNIIRFVGGWSRRFAPLAVAAIGLLPLPLLHRSIAIHMHRPSPDERIDRLNDADPVFPMAREQIRRWAANARLDLDPDIPLRNRPADNWRVLVAIADDLGHGEAARAAALALNAGWTDEDAGVVLLRDIFTIFASRQIDRIASTELVEALLAIEDGLWMEWRGLGDDRPPRKLTQAELARLLRMFDIRPRTIWPLRRTADSKSARGYLREQFEAAWARFCSPDTPTHARPRKYLAEN
jgi:hypothetical protein